MAADAAAVVAVYGGVGAVLVVSSLQLQQPHNERHRPLRLPARRPHGLPLPRSLPRRRHPARCIASLYGHSWPPGRPNPFPGPCSTRSHLSWLPLPPDPSHQACSSLQKPSAQDLQGHCRHL